MPEMQTKLLNIAGMYSSSPENEIAMNIPVSMKVPLVTPDVEIV